LAGNLFWLKMTCPKCSGTLPYRAAPQLRTDPEQSHNRIRKPLSAIIRDSAEHTPSKTHARTSSRCQTMRAQATAPTLRIFPPPAPIAAKYKESH
jgi:hypothetical protein